MEVFWAIIILIIVVYVYFIPSFVATKRGHSAVNGIIFVNLIAGWSLIGWVVCLIWAYSNSESKNTTTKTIINKAALSVADEIRKLDDLRKEGLLTQDEFDLKKNKLLEL
ncbi:MAG: superinfection immunity protein [Woeseiaceae bacterium]